MKDVSIFLATSIIVIFMLYSFSLIKTIPCGNDLLKTFSRNFIHIEKYHLISNLIALYALSRIEEKIGMKRFLLLIIFLLVFNTIIETITLKLYPSFKCSIGFSGVLFGVLSWELVMTKKIDIYLVLSILLITVTPSLKNKNISLVGHMVGAFSGLIGGVIWKYISGNGDLLPKKSNKENNINR